jgi:hypothetical protein
VQGVKVITFMQALPYALRTGQLKVILLASYHGGWFFEFELFDDEGLSVVGARMMSDKSRFTDEDDLIDELWQTPFLVYKSAL